ncbi:hypothetical protein GCM10023184_13910 [Flaviaesturariibacter amylovorans]|uniref:Uncharacterized protein n=1 Tax=Flaviaesturariibacter amylovorans TaxID=1084520 RepID=A0ABP8GKQ1_9BACT
MTLNWNRRRNPPQRPDAGDRGNDPPAVFRAGLVLPLRLRRSLWVPVFAPLLQQGRGGRIILPVRFF